jgi:chemotaxis protein MotB
VISGINSQYHLVIEGHTDDVPLHHGGLYASNWELSAARGFSLMRWLQSLGVPETNMSVVAFAHTRPKVSLEGLTGEKLMKARALNRRVVVHIQ